MLKLTQLFFRKPLTKSKQHRFYLLLLLFVLFFNWIIYFQVSQTYASQQSDIKIILPDSVNIQEGDIVLRNGKGLFSNIFRRSSLNDPKYTHAGVIHKIHNSWYVYHFIDDDLKSGLHIESLLKFIDKNKCSSGAVFRYQLNQAEKLNFDSLLVSANAQSIPFDTDFSLESDSAMYCTEWIAKLFEGATSIKEYIPLTTTGTFKYIAPENLYLNEHCQLVYKYEY